MAAQWVITVQERDGDAVLVTAADMPGWQLELRNVQDGGLAARLQHITNDTKSSIIYDHQVGYIPAVIASVAAAGLWLAGMTSDTRILSQSAKLELIGHPIESAQVMKVLTTAGRNADSLQKLLKQWCT